MQIINHKQSNKNSTLKSIVIIYHSGSGSTKTISELFKERLAEYSIDLVKAAKNYDFQQLRQYDFIMLGFPTYHCAPSTTIMDFIDKIPAAAKPMKAFVFSTCGLYGGNAVKVVIEKLFTKNIITSDYTRIVGPASDGALLFPEPLSRLFSFLSYSLKYHITTKWKLDKAVSQIHRAIHSSETKLRVPLYKWYVPINDIFKYFGEKNYDMYKEAIHILSNRCDNCELCVKNCVRDCLTKNDPHPVFDPKNCEFCLKCIHHCPNKAIIFSEKMKDRIRFNRKFYNQLKKKMLQG